MGIAKFFKAVFSWFRGLLREFINIYADKRESLWDDYGDSTRDLYTDKPENPGQAARLSPKSGKRRISAAKILQRLFVIILIVFFSILAVRIGTR